MCEEVIFGICVVDFHHTRGPEVEYWFGLPDDVESDKLWPNLAFQALPDGSHSFKETSTYFTLLYNKKERRSPDTSAGALPADELGDYTTLFAVSCSRQISSEQLINKDKDVTRSTVQKALVIISTQPIFGQIKDKLSIVTNVFFSQRDFNDRQIISSLYDNLQSSFKALAFPNVSDSPLYVGLCLRKIILDFKREVLVLLKAVMLEKKVLFYGNNVGTLCNIQFGLLSLIPNLISNLRNSGSPLLCMDKSALVPVDSFKTSDRASVFKFLGFPLQLFEKGGLFSPYTPLQQLQDVKDEATKFFVVGTSNSLLSERKDELCDIYVNTDESTIEILDKTLVPMLQLSAHDKKWIESISLIVQESWNENSDETPRYSQFEGSEDFIRWQFEDYLTGLLSSAKLDVYLTANKDKEKVLKSVPDDLVLANPIEYFGMSWVNEWKKTQNFEIFNILTDDRLFDLFPPKHVFSEVDPLKVFQQKFVSTFNNLRKTNSSTHSLSTEKLEKPKEKSSESISKKSVEEKNIEKDSASQKSIASTNPSATKKDFSEKWAAFKELFNKKKPTDTTQTAFEIDKEEEHDENEESESDSGTETEFGSEDESETGSSGSETESTSESDSGSDRISELESTSDEEEPTEIADEEIDETNPRFSLGLGFYKVNSNEKDELDKNVSITNEEQETVNEPILNNSSGTHAQVDMDTLAKLENKEPEPKEEPNEIEVIDIDDLYIDTEDEMESKGKDTAENNTESPQL